ncbi:protein kinase [bacterium]|nr:protein kinase [bacterium]
MMALSMAEQELKLGDYLILEKIAHGGMAQIYKAKTSDPGGIERLVVIKRILPHISSQPEYVDMLIDEAKIAVHFNHGNIAQVYDLGKAGKDYFIVMEYVDGKTLGQILRHFKERGEEIPIDILVYCMIEACKGLDYIHNKTDASGKPLGVVHRDISPQNIIVSYSGTVKIIDFGVAKSLDKLNQTESGVLKGKFAYMSPEQTHGEKIDRRSDIFSSGILLWELLTQNRLFKKKTNQDTIKAVRRAAFVSPLEFREDIPPDLVKILKKALRRFRFLRYSTASQMASELNRFLLKHYPDFKPLRVAQFLYTYFGPEADEKDLPQEVPNLKNELKATPNKKVEITAKTFSKQVGVLRLKNALKWGGAGAVALATLVFLAWSAGAFIAYLNRAHLVLNVSPLEARVKLNGKTIKGEAGVYTIEYESGEKFHVEASLDNYVEEDREYVLEKKETREEEIKLTKKIPQFGSVFVESDPVGAKVYINNMDWGQLTPAEISQLPNDKDVDVGFFMEGYIFSSQKVHIRGGETLKVFGRLEKNYAALEIDSQPPGARVIVNGQETGVTPYVDKKIVPLTTVNITLVMEGYEALNQSLVLSPGENKELALTLKAITP